MNGVERGRGVSEARFSKEFIIKSNSREQRGSS